MDRTTDRTCKQCGTPFRVAFPSIRTQFCSRDCLYVYQRGHPEVHGAKPKIERVCSQCGATYACHPSRVRSKVTRFCSRRCMSLFRSEFLRTHQVDYDADWVKTCEWCGTEYRVTKARDMVVRRYCSETCARRAHKPKMQGENNPNYRHGQNQKAARDTALRHGRNACIVCGWNISIDLHHIVPKRQGGRISPENIAILCPNHHRMAHLGLLTAQELTAHVQASLKTPIASAPTLQTTQAREL